MSEEFNNREELQATGQALDINSVNLDDIQQTILQQMQEDPQDDLDNYESNLEALSSEYSATDYLQNEFYDIAPQEKKYVIAINPDNVPYFEEMEPEARAKLVNKLLTSHQNEELHIPDKDKVSNITKHILVVLTTVAIGFPLIFNMVNASIEATLNSYRQVQSNFEKLYQQKGGIKRKDMSKIQNLQY